MSWFRKKKKNDALALPFNPAASVKIYLDEQAQKKTPFSPARKYFRSASFRRDETVAILGPKNEEYLEALRKDGNPDQWIVQKVTKGENAAAGGRVVATAPIKNDVCYMEALVTVARYEQEQPNIYAASGMEKLDFDPGADHYIRAAHDDFIVFDINGTPHLTENGRVIGESEFAENELAVLEKWKERSAQINAQRRMPVTIMDSASAIDDFIQNANAPAESVDMNKLINTRSTIKEVMINTNDTLLQACGLTIKPYNKEWFAFKVPYRDHIFFQRSGWNGKIAVNHSTKYLGYFLKHTAPKSNLPPKIAAFLNDINTGVLLALCQIAAQPNFECDSLYRKDSKPVKLNQVFNQLQNAVTEKYGDDKDTIQKILTHAAFPDSLDNIRNRLLDMYICIEEVDKMVEAYYEQYKESMETGRPLPLPPYEMETKALPTPPAP